MNRNFAFVQFSDDTEAQAAIKEINGTQHFGRRLGKYLNYSLKTVHYQNVVQFSYHG